MLKKSERQADVHKKEISKVLFGDTTGSVDGHVPLFFRGHRVCIINSNLNDKTFTSSTRQSN